MRKDEILNGIDGDRRSIAALGTYILPNNMFFLNHGLNNKGLFLDASQ